MNARTCAILAAAFALGLSACGGDGDSTTTTAATPPPLATTTVNIVVRNGKVDGGLKTTTLKKGENVVLVVTSDAADEVHLHGYDKSADVTTKMPARVAFVASIPGRFEVELEDRGLQIADLEVRP